MGGGSNINFGKEGSTKQKTAINASKGLKFNILDRLTTDQNSIGNVQFNFR